MPLQSGTRLGVYTIVGPLGAGGMGEVYRARDTKLQRDVAIKVLPASVAADPDRLSRFEREAQVLAALNHPHIGAIYGLQESESVTALVLELVEGPTLADRIAQGPIGLDEAIPIARQIAEALEAAHEAGIIHRDLKPANIKLRPDGTVKVLDFGLAKAFDPASGSGPSAAATELPGPKSGPTYASTEAGIILGTAAYMAPEQARGKPVDKRADIWAFGVVLFEMLSGRRLFEGETISDTLAAVLTKDIDWPHLPPTTPSAIRQLLRRCLERDVRQRLRDIGEARVVLAGGASVVAPSGEAPARRRVGAVVMTAAGSLVIGAVLGWLTSRSAASVTPPRPSRSVIAVQPDGAPIRTPAVSPDGRAVAFESKGRLWLQRLDQWEPRELPGTDGGGSPFWSPDGLTIGYFTERQLMRLSPAGGMPTPICDLSVRAGRAGSPHRSGGVWRADGAIVFTTEPGPALEETTTDTFTTEFGPLYLVSPQGGKARVFIQPPPGVLDFHEPDALPGRSELLVSLHRPTGRDALAIVGTDGSTRILIERRGTEFRRPRYSPTGHLLFHQIDGDVTMQLNRVPSVWAVPFSLARLETTGHPVLIDAGGWPSVADDGTLVVASPPVQVARQLGWFDRQGRLTGTVAPARDWREHLAISPSGTRLLSADAEGIWVSALDGGSRGRITRGSRDSMATWIDEQTIAFTRELDGVLSVFTKRADLAAPEQLVASPARFPSASRDGRYLAFNLLGDRPGSWQPAWIDRHGGSSIVRLSGAHAGGRFPRIAPSGEFLLYISPETGRDEIFVTRFPSGSGKWQVSSDGGGWAGWSAGSDEVFYRRGGRQSAMMSVAVTRGAEPRFAPPTALFEWNEHWAPYYTWAADGTRGLTVVPVGPVRATESLRVIRHWAPDAGSVAESVR